MRDEDTHKNDLEKTGVLRGKEEPSLSQFFIYKENFCLEGSMTLIPCYL